jgi:hypothetical protein
MKKLLVFLLILAVAGGLFAQDAGTFTWTGAARLGTIIDLIPDDPTIAPNNQYAEATLTYNKSALQLQAYVYGNYGTPAVTSSLYAVYGDGINGEANIPYRLAAKIGGSAAGNGYNIFTFDSNLTLLYGWYSFFDNQLKVDVAYKGWDEGFWVTPGELVVSNYANLNGLSGIRFRYTSTVVTGLSAGLVFPGMAGVPGLVADPATELLVTPFKNTVFAAKYANGPLTAAGALKLGPSETEKAYVGVGYTIIPDTLSAKADFEFHNLGGFGDTGFIEAGANVAYTAAPLTAGLTLKVQDDAEGDTGGIALNSNSGILSVFYAKPYVYYNIIADTLQARLPITFAKGINEAAEKVTFIQVIPGLYWNLAATGVTDDPGRGILTTWTIKYDLEAGKMATNAVNLTFRWNF